MENSFAAINFTKLRHCRWLIAIILLAAPLVVDNYYLYYVNLILIYAILTIGLNMVIGFTQMIHLGYAGIFGIGAYAYTSSMLFLKLGFLPSIFFGALVASLVGFLLAVPAVRLSELGFALVSIAFGEAIVTIIGNIEFLGLYNGIMAPKASIGTFNLEGNFRYFYIAYPFALILFVIYLNIMKSPIGRAFIALADSQTAAQSIGVNVNRYRILVFVISSFYAGIAGGLFALLVKFIDPNSFGMSETILLLMMLIIGGAGNYFGPVLGAALLAFMPEIVREFKEYRALIYGIALVNVIIFLPEGIGGRLSIWWNALRKKRNHEYT